MNTFSMAVKNFKKNFSFYALYLISVSLVITVFFAFSSFSKNSIMLEKISSDGRVESMCSVISVCLMAFVVFYMSHSNRFFLKRRTKELGIYSLLGYRRSIILSLLIFENILICSCALLVGLILGTVLHKGIVYGTTILLNLTIDNSQIPFFNFGAIKSTVGFILIVIIAMLISNARFLFKSSLMDLVRFEKKAEKRMKFGMIPALLGFVFILTGYGIAMNILKGADSIWFSFGFYPTGLLTFILVVWGTILFINSFLPFVVQMSKQNKKAFYSETKIITTPNFVYKIRSNSKTLIMLSLLSAATLTVSSVAALSLYYPIAAVDRMSPSEIEFRIENDSQIDTVKGIVSKYVSVNEVIFTQTDIFKVTAEGEHLPMEYDVGTAKGDSNNEKILRNAGFDCISYSQYVALLQAQSREDAVKKLSELEDSMCILVKYQPNDDKSDEAGSIYQLNINGSSTPLTVKETTLNNPISFANSVGTLIVSDSVYEQMKSHMTPETSILSINGSVIENNEDLFSEIGELLNGSPYLQGNTHRVNEIVSLNSSTFLLIGFLVALFFIATGSILYFNNVSSISDTKSDYEILGKMGCSNKTIKRIIKKQVMTFFFIPFCLGLIDCFFSSIVYKTGLMQNLLGNRLALYVPTIIAIVMTALIYLIYYLLTVRTCYKTVFNH